MLAQPALAAIREAVEAACAAPGSRPAMAAFMRHASDGGLHCQVHVYFAPAARELAEQFGAVPCEKPALQGLELLGGNVDDAARLE
jgi:hypothetical protein